MGTKKLKKKKKTKSTKTEKATKTVKAAKLDTINFNISVPKSFLKKVDAGAKRASLTRSAYVRQQLQSHI